MTMAPSSDGHPAPDDGHPGDRPDTADDRTAPGWREVAQAHPWMAPVLGLLLTALGGWLFAGLSEQVYEGGPLLRLDRNLLEVIAAHRTPTAVHVFGVVTYLGEGIVTVCVAAVAAVVLVRLLRSWAPALLLALTTTGAALTVFLVKLLIARPRPVPAPNAATEDSFAFPSGHSTHSAAVYLMVALLFLRVLRTQLGKAAALASALLLIAVTGLSRLVLGVHSPTDVLAGWILGACFTVALLSMWGLSAYLPRFRAHLVRRARNDGDSPHSGGGS